MRDSAVRLAFEFLVLTAARSGEVRLATWDEIDTAGAVWTVPAARMKAKREYRVPLCGRALEVLDAALGRSAAATGSCSGCGAVGRLPRGRSRRCSSTTKSRPCRTAFRSSFRDWAAGETDHPREVIEAALAHVIHRTRWTRPTHGRTCSSAGGG